MDVSTESSPANSINGANGSRGKLPKPKSIRRWKRSAQKDPADDDTSTYTSTDTPPQPPPSRGHNTLSQQTTAAEDGLLDMVDAEDASGRFDDELL